MTPEARLASAIDILDRMIAGAPIEPALVNWARQSRFAGSRDRAAVRDLVFEAWRCRRSYAWRGGSLTGRGLMLGRCWARKIDPADVFSGQGYGPPALTSDERPISVDDAPAPVRYDCPDWLWPYFLDSLGDDMARAVLSCLQSRAAVFLRTNVRQVSRADAMAQLAAEDIQTEPHALSPTALKVVSNPRRLHGSRAYQSGDVELQDAASQAVVDSALEFSSRGTVLDYCAGGGGKTLAMAARGLRVTAHDVNPNRMKDIPERAARAGVEIPLTAKPQGTFDMVLCDVPCSGSGAWRRQPDAKWLLTEDRLNGLTETQDRILHDAKARVRPGGVLAYATCSLFDIENRCRIESFLKKNAGWNVLIQKTFTPLDGGDGFFIACLRRPN